jgi:type IV secretory pathway TraG/TraD family ATPase VirD4
VESGRNPAFCFSGGRCWLDSGAGFAVECRAMKLRRKDYGDACFSDYGDLKRQGMLEPGGIVIGRALQLHRPYSEQHPYGDGGTQTIEYLNGAGPISLRACHEGGMLHYGGPDSQDHMVVVAPTRSGKTTGVIIPNCAYYLGSILVIDPKGEVAELTADHRAQALRQKVYVIDPKSVTRFAKSGIDVLSYIDPEKPMLGCNNIASILNPAPAQQEAYWHEEANWIMSALLGMILTHPEIAPEDRKIGTLRHYIMREAEDRDRIINLMLASKLQFVRHGGETLKGLLASEKQYEGVRANMRTATNFLEDEDLCAALEKGDCDLRRMKRERMSIYIVPSQPILRVYPAFARLIIECLLLAFEEDKRLAPFSPLLLVDEFSNLGKMDVLARSFSIAGGFGLRIVAVTQDLGQLQETYGQHRYSSMMENCGLKVWMAPSGHYTNSPQLSRELGQTTITHRTRVPGQYRQSSGGRLFDSLAGLAMPDETKKVYGELRQAEEGVKQALWNIWPGRWQEQTQGHAIPLMTPDQLNNQPVDAIFITRSNNRPIYAKRLKSYADQEFSYLYRPQPTQKSDRDNGRSERAGSNNRQPDRPPLFSKLDPKDWIV